MTQSAASHIQSTQVCSPFQSPPLSPTYHAMISISLTAHSLSPPFPLSSKPLHPTNIQPRQPAAKTPALAVLPLVPSPLALITPIKLLLLLGLETKVVPLLLMGKGVRRGESSWGLILGSDEEGKGLFVRWVGIWSWYDLGADRMVVLERMEFA